MTGVRGPMRAASERVAEKHPSPLPPGAVQRDGTAAGPYRCKHSGLKIRAMPRYRPRAVGISSRSCRVRQPERRRPWVVRTRDDAAPVGRRVAEVAKEAAIEATSDKERAVDLLHADTRGAGQCPRKRLSRTRGRTPKRPADSSRQPVPTTTWWQAPFQSVIAPWAP